MHILITGANGALGQAVTALCLAEGHQVTALSRSSPSSSANPPNPKLDSRSVDLVDAAATQVALQSIQAEGFGPIQGALLLAGGFAFGDIAASSPQTVQTQLGMNFFTAYNVVQPLLAGLLAQRSGHIICIGARPARYPETGGFAAAYTLSKALLSPLVALINAAGKGHGVRASLLIPSIIDTPANRAAMPEADPSTWVTPDQIAEAALLLLGNAASSWHNPLIELYADA